NNTSLASYVYPELSSVAVGTEEMGMAAINMLKDQLTASKQPLAKRVELETRLIFRQSTL
ncbi:substrate-binding domain-containing protein, partial [Oenococcus oeni]